MPRMKFHNYMPMTKEMQKSEPLVQNRVKDVEAHFKFMTDKLVNDFMTDDQKSLNILPKKTNNDLKRFLAKRFERLNKRTEIATVEILREKLTGLRIDEPPVRRNVEENDKPNNGTSKKKGQDDSFEYESGEDSKDGVNDFDEERNDDMGANLVEKMKLHEKMNKRHDSEESDDDNYD